MKRSHTQKLRKVVHFFFLFFCHFLYCSARAFPKIVIVCVYWRLHTPYSRKYIWYFLLSICFINRARVCTWFVTHAHHTTTLCCCCCSSLMLLLLLVVLSFVVVVDDVIPERRTFLVCFFVFFFFFWLSVCAFGLFVLFASSSSLLGFFIRFWMCIMKCSKTTNV